MYNLYVGSAVSALWPSPSTRVRLLVNRLLMLANHVLLSTVPVSQKPIQTIETFISCSLFHSLLIYAVFPNKKQSIVKSYTLFVRPLRPLNASIVEPFGSVTDHKCRCCNCYNCLNDSTHQKDIEFFEYSID